MLDGIGGGDGSGVRPGKTFLGKASTHLRGSLGGDRLGMSRPALSPRGRRRGGCLAGRSVVGGGGFREDAGAGGGGQSGDVRPAGNRAATGRYPQVTTRGTRTIGPAAVERNQSEHRTQTAMSADRSVPDHFTTKFSRNSNRSPNRRCPACANAAGGDGLHGGAQDAQLHRDREFRERDGRASQADGPEGPADGERRATPQQLQVTTGESKWDTIGLLPMVSPRGATCCACGGVRAGL